MLTKGTVHFNCTTEKGIRQLLNSHGGTERINRYPSKFTTLKSRNTYQSSHLSSDS